MFVLLNTLERDLVYSAPGLLTSPDAVIVRRCGRAFCERVLDALLDAGRSTTLRRISLPGLPSHFDDVDCPTLAMLRGSRVSAASRSNRKGRWFVLTGNPGTGKSMWTNYLLMICQWAGISVMQHNLQSGNGVLPRPGRAP